MATPRINGVTHQAGKRLFTKSGYDSMVKSAIKHGKSTAVEYSVWTGMKKRCHNQREKDYKYYGGRGIKLCDRWQNVENFIADMGPRPSAEHSIDRINNDGDYEPSNCRWATREEQAVNKRSAGIWLVHGITYKGKRAAAKAIGISTDTLKRRCKNPLFPEYQRLS